MENLKLVNRKFSIPFGGDDTEKFIELFEPYIENIHSVFFGLPALLDYKPFQWYNLERFRGNEIEIKKLLNSKFSAKKLLVFNRSVFSESHEMLKIFIKNEVIPFVKTYGVDGLIIADFYLARFIREQLPNIEIQTSCNAHIFTKRIFQRWVDEVGIAVHNPPRDCIRDFRFLKEMREWGIPIKAIINEACVHGCPMSIWDTTRINKDKEQYCSFCESEDCLKTNVILPRWLSELDPYIDIYKIVGRHRTSDETFKIFKAYLDEDNTVDLNMLATGCFFNKSRTNREVIQIPVSKIPDKVLRCNNADCRSCKICKRLYQELGGK